MLSIFHYYSAKERLAESKKTIHMMGGENECQPMLLGQRDFLKLEVEYYQEECFKSIAYLIVTIVIVVPLAYFYLKN